MNIGQLISGLVLIFGGLILVVVAIISGFKGGGWIALVYGIPALILGIAILLYQKEDEIEQVKRIFNKEGKGGRKKWKR